MGQRLFGGWTVSTIVQARSGQNLTPFFSGFYTTSPWNTGKPLDGLGNFFCCAWRPDQIRDPNIGGSRDAFFNQAAYAIPAPGKLGNAKKGSLQGPGTWVVNFAFYKDVSRRTISGCSSRRCSTTRSTIRSSSLATGAGSSISHRTWSTGIPTTAPRACWVPIP